MTDEDGGEGKDGDKDHDKDSGSGERRYVVDEHEGLIGDGAFDMEIDTDPVNQLLDKSSTRPKKRQTPRFRIGKPSRLLLKGMPRRKEEIRLEAERRTATTQHQTEKLEGVYPGAQTAIRSRDTDQLGRLFNGSPQIVLTGTFKRNASNMDETESPPPPRTDRYGPDRIDTSKSKGKGKADS